MSQENLLDNSEDSEAAYQNGPKGHLLGFSNRRKHRTQRPLTSSRASRLSKYIVWVNLGLFFILLTLLSIIVKREFSENQALIPGSDEYGISPECKPCFSTKYHIDLTYLPVSLEIITFNNDSAYVPEDPREFFTKNTHQKWLDMVPSKAHENLEDEMHQTNSIFRRIWIHIN